MGAEVVGGATECAQAVRRQIGTGADWIKVYADYPVRSRMADVAPGLAEVSQPTFTKEELQVILDTAKARGVKVAAHAADLRHVFGLTFDTLEHGGETVCNDRSESNLDGNKGDAWRTLLPGQTIWVPTLSVYYTFGGQKWSRVVANFREALSAGVERVACGGDTGAFAHGENALELRLMVALGAPWQKVLAWATLGGWQCVRPSTWEGREGRTRLDHVHLLRESARTVGDNEVAFGVLRRGFAADIIATTGDLECDFGKAVSKESIVFVMKGGKVYKKDGKEVV